MKIHAMYWSATGTTRTVVRRIAQTLAARAGAAVTGHDFTRPAMRTQEIRFGPDDLVVFGTPVYAGRVPNVLLPFLRTVQGGGALAVPVVLFGNRNFDDGLIELRDLLVQDGFRPIAGAAFVGQHAFSRVLAAGRPDADDLALADRFAEQIWDKVCSGVGLDTPVAVRGEQPIRPYYTPRDRAGRPINILKVKPKTDAARCDGCGKCVAVCPMGSIDPGDPTAVTGICIKCCACERICPTGAKYFDDPGYLYHKEELELGNPDRKAVALFL